MLCKINYIPTKRHINENWCRAYLENQGDRTLKPSTTLFFVEHIVCANEKLLSGCISEITKEIFSINYP